MALGLQLASRAPLVACARPAAAARRCPAAVGCRRLSAAPACRGRRYGRTPAATANDDAVAAQGHEGGLGSDPDDFGLGGVDGTAECEAALGQPPPMRHQRPLDIKKRKEQRARAETLARDRKLVRVQVGQQGLTQAFLRAAADALTAHELVRVKLGDGCGLERGEAAELLERYLDCVVVHQVGFTVTVFREAGLPRLPGTLSSAVADERAKAAAEAAAAAAQATNHAAEEKAARKRAGQLKPQQRPPEISMVG